MNTEVTRGQFLKILLGSATTAVGAFAAGCSGGRAERKPYSSPSSDTLLTQASNAITSPVVLAASASEPLAAYLRQLDIVARSFIHAGYLEQGVNLSRPNYKNFGLSITEEDLIADKTFKTVKGVIHAGLGGRQPFAIENRYQPGMLTLVQSRILTGTFGVQFIRPDLIPGKPLGDKRDVELIPTGRMDQLHHHIFNYPQPVRWQNPDWIGPYGSDQYTMVLRGADQNKRFVVQVFSRLVASLLVD